MEETDHGTYTAHEGEKNTCNILVRKPEGKKPHGIYRHKWIKSVGM
jgi:hypothetical protein